MNAKGTLIAALAAGYFASAVPAVAHAADAEKPAKGEKASCKGKGGCKGHDKKDEKKAEKKDGEKPAPEAK